MQREKNTATRFQDSVVSNSISMGKSIVKNRATRVPQMARSGAPCKKYPVTRVFEVAGQKRYRRGQKQAAPPSIFPIQSVPGSYSKKASSLFVGPGCPRNRKPVRRRTAAVVDVLRLCDGVDSWGYRRESVSRYGSEAALPLLPNHNLSFPSGVPPAEQARDTLQ
jgi:hypothetical protein